MTKTPKVYLPGEYEELSKDVSYDMEKFKDPYVVGAMIHRLVEERKLSNKRLQEINAKLERILSFVDKGKGVREEAEPLSELESQIVEYVKSKDWVSAEDVQSHFKYKGKNAASARLNSLEKQGHLKKKRAGRTVLFSCSRWE